jgi:uncharacterized caspase-like protein
MILRELWLAVLMRGVMAGVPMVAAAQDTAPIGCSNAVDAPPITGRYALLVTNQEYPRSVGPLEATHRDGEILCEALAKLGFDVRHVRDANLQVFQQELLQHIRRLHAALARGIEATGFFYFSGHGAVMEKDGDNFQNGMPTMSFVTVEPRLRRAPYGKR